MNQRFSDDQVARILSRAAELQNVRDEKQTTLEDIERAASEAGIDVALVRAAAQEMRLSPTPPASGFFGPRQVSVAAAVNGELDEAAKARLHEAVLHATGLPMTVTAIGHTLDWQYQDLQTSRRLRVVVASRDGHTEVRVEEPLGGLMGGIYGGVGGGAGSTAVMLAAMAGVLAIGPVGGVVLGAASAVASVFGTRSLYQALAQRRAHKAEQVLKDVVGVVSDLVVVHEDALSDARARQGRLAPVEALETVREAAVVER